MLIHRLAVRLITPLGTNIYQYILYSSNRVGAVVFNIARLNEDEAIFLDAAMVAMTPKRESKSELVMSTYI